MKSARWAPLFAAVLFFAVAGVWLARDTERARHAYPPGSSLNTGEEGMSLAQAFLEQRGAQVIRLEDPLELKALESQAVLIRVDPVRVAARAARQELETTPLEEDGGPRVDGGSDGGESDGGLGDAGSDGGVDAGRSIAEKLFGDHDSDDGEDSDASADAGAGRRRAITPMELWFRLHDCKNPHAADAFALDDLDEQFVRRGGTLFIAAPGCRKTARDGERDAGADAGPADEVAGGLDERTDDEDDPDAEAGAADAGDGGAILEALGDKVLPVFPAVRELHLTPTLSLPAKVMVDAQPVFEMDQEPAVAIRKLGLGQVWMVDEPFIFENQQLGNGDHLALLAAIAEARRPVVFDETVHGFARERGLSELFRGWGLIPALFIAGLACALLFWRRAATVGEPADGWRDTRSEAIDFVDSAASLFERALLPSDALVLYETHIAREIGLRLGVTHDAAKKRLAALAPGLRALTAGAPMSEREFQAQLQLLTHALERFRDEHHRSSND